MQCSAAHFGRFDIDLLTALQLNTIAEFGQAAHSSSEVAESESLSMLQS